MNQIWTSVEGSGKKLSSKTNFSALLQISCSNSRLKLCQGLNMKIVKRIKFEGVLSKLEARNCSQTQPFTKYLKQFLVSM